MICQFDYLDSLLSIFSWCDCGPWPGRWGTVDIKQRPRTGRSHRDLPSLRHSPYLDQPSPRHRRIKSKQHYYLASTYNYHNIFIWFCAILPTVANSILSFSHSCLSVAFGEMGTLKHFNGIFNIYTVLHIWFVQGEYIQLGQFSVNPPRLLLEVGGTST